VIINIKYVAEFTVPDCVNYYLNSNHPDSFFLEDRDRRFFVHEVRGAPLEEDFYKAYDTWLHTDGPSYLFYYLLRLSLDGFNPKAAAPMTDAKRDMTSLVKSDLGLWVARLAEDPDAMLVMDGKPLTGDLWETSQLLRLYDPDSSTKVTANGLGRELRRAGFRQAGSGGITRLADGSTRRLYAIRNQVRWARSTNYERAKEVGQVTVTKAKY